MVASMGPFHFSLNTLATSMHQAPPQSRDTAKGQGREQTTGCLLHGLEVLLATVGTCCMVLWWLSVSLCLTAFSGFGGEQGTVSRN